MAEPDLYWTGASGKKYGYWSKELPYSCDPNQDGNYIFCKILKDLWVPVYIGQGDINDRVNDKTHFNCATGKGATHVHAHTNATEKNRLAEGEFWGQTLICDLQLLKDVKITNQGLTPLTPTPLTPTPLTLINSQTGASDGAIIRVRRRFYSVNPIHEG